MEYFAGPHLVAIAVTVAAGIAAATLPRRVPTLRAAGIGVVAAVTLATIWTAMFLDRLDPFDAGRDLPFHLSDWALAAAVVALASRVAWAVELAWFWGLAGASWAVATPDLARGFEDLGTWGFFIVHGGVIAAALWLVVGRAQLLRRGAAVRAGLITAGVVVVAGSADLITGGNYMYLREPPPRGSPLDLAGPWPWYLLAAFGLAVILLWALERPVQEPPADC